MRAVVGDWDDEYDDLSSFEPDARAVRRLLPEPPLPPSAAWCEAAEPSVPNPAEGRAKPVIGIALFATQCAAAAWFLLWLTRGGLFDNPVGWVWIVAVIVAFGLGAFAIWRYSMAAYEFPHLGTLADDMPRFDVFPVRVRIVQDRTVTGIDHGVAWFAQDALHFKGFDTEFVVGAQDLRYDPLAIGVGRGALEQGWAMPRLALRHPDRALSIVFQPMARFDRSDKRDCGYRFRHHLRLFLKHWRPSRVASVYPPLTRQPSLAAQKGRIAVESPSDATSTADV